MKPDRSNYEIWIIDWLDGKLDKSAIELFMAFLDANPDLREEADSLSISRLTSEKNKYMTKEPLRKTVSQLPLSQVEYLSVAYLENDITTEQISDLEQSIDLNIDNKKVFNTIQKIKLIPPQLIYKNKNLLKKKTAEAKILRFATIGLSVAATIAVLILSYIFLPRYLSQKNYEAEQTIVSESYLELPFDVRARIYLAPGEEPAGRDLKNLKPGNTSLISYTDEISSQPSMLAVTDTSVSILRPSETEIPGVPVFSEPAIIPEISTQYLAGTNNIFSRGIFDYDEERSRFSRFIARNFREKILKDPVINDSPLKSYEIAEAGIEGLNKLLGWEMALVKNTNEEGELKSIYFSSRVLKFNAPVKKTEPLP